MTKYEIQYKIDRLQEQISALQDELDCTIPASSDIIADLLSKRSHIERSNIKCDRETKTEVWFKLHTSFFSGDGSLDLIYEKTGFHVVQCANGTGNYIRLRFKRDP